MPAKGMTICPNPKCGSTNLLARVDGTFFCRKCGYDTRSKDKQEKKP